MFMKVLIQLTRTNVFWQSYFVFWAFGWTQNQDYAQSEITSQYLKKVFNKCASLSTTKINPFSFKLLHTVTISGIVYHLSGQVPCCVNQSVITMEQQISTAVSWCLWGHDWQAGEVVPPVFSKRAYWCPGYTSTSQHTSSPLRVHSHQLSPSPIWFAWKPPQQSHSPWLRTPWKQHPRNQQVSFPPLAW